ncbi:VWA domain-containing protein [Myxococcota bacterium]|nr:VWA domain-containing protein [Myxococcota bacterium]
MRRAFSLLSLLSIVGCENDYNVARNEHTDVFLQEPVNEVDILWVIDDSVSMSQEQERVSNAFETFISSIADANIDFHLGVITTDMDTDNPNRGELVGKPKVITGEDDYVKLFRDRVTVGTEGADQEKGLSAALRAVTEPMVSGANAGFLRPDAHLSIIFVSDENDCSDGDALAGQPGSSCYDQRDKLLPVADFVQDFKDLKDGTEARVLASAIVGPEVAAGCSDSWPGARYWSVADGTGGIIGDICETDYSGLMGELGLEASGILSTFSLTYAAVEETIVVLVGEEEIPKDAAAGWTYDAEYWIVRFDGSYVPPRGTTISITYEVLNGGSRPDEATTTE